MYIFTRWYTYQKPKKVLQQQAKHYQHLLMSDINVEFTYVNHGPKLTEEEKLAHENPITVGDKFPKDSTLSTDGLQVHFYCKFWDKLKKCSSMLYNMPIQKRFYIYLQDAVSFSYPKEKF